MCIVCADPSSLQGVTVEQLFQQLDASGDGLVAGYELRRGLVEQGLNKLEAALVGLLGVHGMSGIRCVTTWIQMRMMHT